MVQETGSSGPAAVQKTPFAEFRPVVLLFISIIKLNCGPDCSYRSLISASPSFTTKESLYQDQKPGRNQVKVHQGKVINLL